MATIKVQTEDFDVSREIAALTAGRSDIGGIGCFGGLISATTCFSQQALVWSGLVWWAVSGRIYNFK